MAGTEHPIILARRLHESSETPVKPPQLTAVTAEELASFTKAAARAPNEKILLFALMDVMEQEQPHLETILTNPELYGSIAVAYVHSRAMPPLGFGGGWCRVTHAAHMLGRTAQVLDAARRERERQVRVTAPQPCQVWAAEAKMDACEFAEAAQSIIELSPNAGPFQRQEELLDEAAVCAVLANRPDLLDAIAGMTKPIMGDAKGFVAGCKKYLAGSPVDRTDFPAANELDLDLILPAEAELAQGGDFTQPSRQQLWIPLKNWTNDLSHWRLKWILLDRYCRLQSNLPNMAGFYEAAQWLFPDDAYVKAASAAATSRGISTTLPSVDEIIRSLSSPSTGQAEPIPEFAAVARIHRDLIEKRPGDAKRLFDKLKARSAGTVLVGWLQNRINEAAQ